MTKGHRRGLSRGQRGGWSLGRMQDGQAGGSELLDRGPEASHTGHVALLGLTILRVGSGVDPSLGLIFPTSGKKLDPLTHMVPPPSATPGPAACVCVPRRGPPPPLPRSSFPGAPRPPFHRQEPRPREGPEPPHVTRPVGGGRQSRAGLGRLLLPGHRGGTRRARLQTVPAAATRTWTHTCAQPGFGAATSWGSRLSSRTPFPSENTL